MKYLSWQRRVYNTDTHTRFSKRNAKWIHCFFLKPRIKILWPLVMLNIHMTQGHMTLTLDSRKHNWIHFAFHLEMTACAWFNTVHIVNTLCVYHPIVHAYWFRQNILLCKLQFSNNGYWIGQYNGRGLNLFGAYFPGRYHLPPGLSQIKIH